MTTPTREEMLEKIQQVIWLNIYDSYSDDDNEYPVMIWDILEFADKLDKKWEKYWYTLCNKIIDLRKDKRKPIDDQSNECIAFIFSLLPNER
jgi:hypothetical protein